MTKCTDTLGCTQFCPEGSPRCDHCASLRVGRQKMANGTYSAKDAPEDPTCCDEHERWATILPIATSPLAPEGSGGFVMNPGAWRPIQASDDPGLTGLGGPVAPTHTGLKGIRDIGLPAVEPVPLSRDMPTMFERATPRPPFQPPTIPNLSIAAKRIVVGDPVPCLNCEGRGYNLSRWDDDGRVFHKVCGTCEGTAVAIVE